MDSDSDADISDDDANEDDNPVMSSRSSSNSSEDGSSTTEVLQVLPNSHWVISKVLIIVNISQTDSDEASEDDDIVHTGGDTAWKWTKQSATAIFQPVNAPFNDPVVKYAQL